MRLNLKRYIFSWINNLIIVLFYVLLMTILMTGGLSRSIISLNKT